MYKYFKNCVFFILIVSSCFPTNGAKREMKSYAQLINTFPNLKCNFESSCTWKWHEEGFSNVTAEQVKAKYDLKEGLTTDGDQNEKGHFLFAYDKTLRQKELNITSEEIGPEYLDKSFHELCTLSLMVISSPPATISVLIQEPNRTRVIAKQLANDVKGTWQMKKYLLGRPDETFKIILEINGNSEVPSYVGIDNLQIEKCFPDVSGVSECPADRKFRCTTEKVCLPLDMVCDISRDCSGAEDEEQQICHEVPAGTRCTFENGWCGWQNSTDKYQTLRWKLNKGQGKDKNIGPSVDNTLRNSTGTYAYVDMSAGGTLGSLALMESAEIYPPPLVHGNPHSPYYNSCYVTFFYHKYGPHSGSLALYLIEHKLDGTKPSYRLWWSYGNKGDHWLRQVVQLPNVTERYTLQFEARKSMSSRGDVAVDDISFSPRCFGIGIPEKELDGYDYYDYPKSYSGAGSINPSFVKQPIYSFSTCGNMGADGPTPEDCQSAYMNTSTKVTVLEEIKQKGIQKWIVPDTSYYTIISKGARGGKGADALGTSRGAVARIITQLYKGQSIYMMVGQEGQDACKKMSFDTPGCITENLYRTEGRPNNIRLFPETSKPTNGGGGGGGATSVFTWIKGYEPEPLVVAGGGGGLAHGPSVNDGRQHGKTENYTLPNTTAPSFGLFPAGAGGGWRAGNFSNSNYSGTPILEGGRGGSPCNTTHDQVKGYGGFGGGGGGCVAGGGGGGYTGGRAWSDSDVNGEGGWSTTSQNALYQEVKTGPTHGHEGSGMVLIIPAVPGCGCSYLCVALNEHRSITKCVCPDGWKLGPDEKFCIQPIPPSSTTPFWIAVTVLFLLSVLFVMISLVLYGKYVEQRSKKLSMINGQSVVLSAGGTSVRLTELNPNYEFGGFTYTVRDLKEIPRERVQLVKPLGCGAFGDVYQGLLRLRDNDAVDLAVAIKVLPALSSKQAEDDFLMEALIMSKFNHPNIVHFIGACFDTHPRYIILELLAGGDLKNFLRENRPKANKPSALTMKDLLQCALDVAKGCQYLEELHFIHRDIAARNCLLTSLGPGRVVKIADFGMSRDIYRSDYYKKGGKAMLPIKWMPPEAFLDGIFSTKTDVWSFGVLLWEVMSLGFMPYTGVRNRDVMMFVARGARLAAPANCPAQVYALMTMCWHQEPSARPTFATIVERVGYCLQDPVVTDTKLPKYTGPLPSELEGNASGMPKGDEDSQADYMVPIKPCLEEIANCASLEGQVISGDAHSDTEQGSTQEIINAPPPFNLSFPGRVSPIVNPVREAFPALKSGHKHKMKKDENHIISDDIKNNKPFTVSGRFVQDQRFTNC